MEAFDFDWMETEDQTEEQFVIDSDEKAEWAIRKIAEEQAEFDRLSAVCQAEIDKYTRRKDFYQNRLNTRTDGLKSLLQAYFETVHVKDTKTQQKYELPSGSLILKKASSDYKPDTDKLRAWLESGNMTDYLKTEISPKWAAVKKQLSTAANGDIIFAETGEVLPDGCITVEEKPARFEVKPSV